MKAVIFLNVLWLISVQAVAQSVNLKGKVVNINTNEPVLYAAVGLINANKGVSTDETGQFELADADKGDTLVVSCVGFKRVLIPVKNVSSVIQLTPSVLELPVVTVKPSKSKKLLLNEFKRNSIRLFYATQMNDTASMVQLAQYFENPGSATWFVSNLNIARGRYYPKANDKVKFRLRFYGIDEKGRPDVKDICESILLKDKNHNIIKVDLSKYNLIIPPKGLFVAIEWIKTNENFYEFEYLDSNNVKKSSYWYKPSIGMALPKFTNNTVFTLNYKGVWNESKNFNSKRYDSPKEINPNGFRKLAISLEIHN